MTDDKAFAQALKAIIANDGWPVLVASPKTLLDAGRLPLEMYEFKAAAGGRAIPVIVKDDAPTGDLVLMDARRMALSAVLGAVVERAREEDARRRKETEK